MDSVKYNKTITYSAISDTPKSEESIAFGRKLKLEIPAITVSMADIIVSQVTDIEHFFPQPSMRSIDYLHTEKLEERAIKKRVWRMRAGSDTTHFDNKGLTFWKHVQDQQIALKDMSRIFDKFPTEVVVNMERGGTFLYDSIEPYISKDARPNLAISIAKELPCKKHRAKHIRRTVNEIQKLSEIGYKSFVIMDVAVSGGQLFKLIKTLNAVFCDDMPEVHLLFLKQSLTEKTSFVKGLDVKIEKQLSKSSKLNLHLFTAPFIVGEDVCAHLAYGVQNQYPVNVILPDETVWQCKSSSGTRKTLLKILSGQVNPLISSLYTE